MSNRRRASRGVRTSRVPRPRRPPAVRAARDPARRVVPRWWGGRWLPVALAVVAEGGHLAAAYGEWPGSATRGGYHVATAALLGLLAAVLSVRPSRVVLAAGAVVGGAGPVAWLAGSTFGGSPYGQVAMPVAAGVSAAEAVLVALLVTAWWGAATPTTRPAAQPARSRPARSQPARSGVRT